MTLKPYFSTVTSDAAFKARFRAENGKTFSELENVAASSWGRSHLLACRVVLRSHQHKLLPILSKHAERSDVESPPDEIRAFLQGPDSTLMAQSEHYLVRGSGYGISLAQIWAAMAMFKGSQDRRIRDVPTMQEQNESEQNSHSEARQPKRPRQSTSQSGFINSSRMQVGSSSPTYDSSHDGSQGSSVGYVDADTHYMSIIPEDDTLRLASCVIRHILYFAPPQNSASESTVVEFRDAKTRLVAVTYEERRIVAVDDGGLCLRQQKPDGGFILANNHVAILEAKNQFQRLHDGPPVISDEALAQMVCEALATRLSNLTDESLRRVMIINATQHYMCFLEIDISDEYVEDFESDSPTHMLNVNSTPWFDLSEKSGRRNILANLCGIIRRAMSK